MLLVSVFRVCIAMMTAGFPCGFCFAHFIISDNGLFVFVYLYTYSMKFNCQVVVDLNEHLNNQMINRFLENKTGLILFFEK